jgi:hypothetical protein
VPVRNGSNPVAPGGGQRTQLVPLFAPEDGAAAPDAAELRALAAGDDVLVVPVHEVGHAMVAAVVTVDVVVCAAAGLARATRSGRAMRSILANGAFYSASRTLLG